MVQTERHTDSSSPAAPAPARAVPASLPATRAPAGEDLRAPVAAAVASPGGATDEEMALALLRGERWAERVAGEWATGEEYPLTAAVRRMLRAAEIGREAVRTTSNRETYSSGGGRNGLHIAYQAAIHLEAALHTLDTHRRQG